VIFEFGPLWQLALATPVGLYSLANAAVLSAGGVGSLLAARLTLSKPATIVGVAGLLVGSSLGLVVVKNAVVVILAQGVLAAGGVGVTMVFTRLLHDSLSSRVRAGAASGVGALSSIAFVLFALIFGVVSQHVGIFHAGWMVVGVTLLASMLLVKVALGKDFKGRSVQKAYLPGLCSTKSIISMASSISIVSIAPRICVKSVQTTWQKKRL
jgi:hypothetical protein